MDLFLFLSTLPLLKEIVLFIQTGGLLLWPLIILSLFMWVLITEKFINLALGNSSTKNTTQRDVNILFLDSIVKSEIADDDLPKKYSFMIVNHKGKPLKYKDKIKN